MPYNVAALKALINLREDVEIDVISWGYTKKLTPYKPPEIERVRYFDELDFNYDQLKAFFLLKKHDLIYVCNRRENKFLKLALLAQKMKIFVIGQSDEQLFPTFKQYVKKVVSYFIYRRYFNFMIVSGYYQYEFMRFLGFKKNQIQIGAYTANVSLFNKFYLDTIHNDLQLNKKILYIGRLEVEKDILFALETFKEFKTKNRIDIKFIIIGNGKLLNEILKFDFIEYHAFLDQSKIIDILSQVSFFILPSKYEPWGVVIHEMAAAGIPIICSDSCGARSAFVFNDYNGFVFRTNDKKSLQKVLFKSFDLGNTEWKKFRQRSNQLSKTITPELWAATVNSFI